jgi:hypothetical protein
MPNKAFKTDNWTKLMVNMMLNIWKKAYLAYGYYETKDLLFYSIIVCINSI